MIHFHLQIPMHTVLSGGTCCVTCQEVSCCHCLDLVVDSRWGKSSREENLLFQKRIHQHQFYPLISTSVLWPLCIDEDHRRFPASLGKNTLHERPAVLRGTETLLTLLCLKMSLRTEESSLFLQYSQQNKQFPLSTCPQILSLVL